ncbi:MAG: hypothetical protein PVJ86_04005 [Phycisphaerales bacterium]|jgi:hypothetical protein
MQLIADVKEAGDLLVATVFDLGNGGQRVVEATLPEGISYDKAIESAETMAHIVKGAACSCIGGIVGDDEDGPVPCKRCLPGLEQAMTNCITWLAGLQATERDYAVQEQSAWVEDARKFNQVSIDTVRLELLRLEAMYAALVAPDPIQAWQRRPDEVRQQVAVLATLQEVRA